MATEPSGLSEVDWNAWEERVINSGAPTGPERFSWEALSRIPREVTGFRILGKSVGDLAKEAAVSGAVGALFRIGLGSAGVGGIALGATAGAGVAGIMEIRRQAIENQRAHPERTALKEKLKSLNPHDKKRLVMAIGRGAVFGAAGGIVGGWVSETGFGQVVKEGFSRVGEAKDQVTGAIGSIFQAQPVETPTFQPQAAVEVPTATATTTPTATATPTSTPTPSATPLPSPTEAPTVAPISEPILSPEEPTTPTSVPTAAPTETSTPPATSTATPTTTLGPVSATPVSVESPIPTPEPSPTVLPPSPTPEPVIPFPTPEPAPAPGESIIEPQVLPETEIPSVPQEAPSAEPPLTIKAGPDSPEIKLPDDTQDWMKGANDINAEYGLMKQAEVGSILPNIDQILQDQGFTEANTDPVTLDAIRNHLQHVAEVEVNKAFDSHLQEAVDKNMTLDQIKEIGHNAFKGWIDNEASKELAEQVNLVTQVHDQINDIVNTTHMAIVPQTAPPGVNFESAFDSWYQRTGNLNISLATMDPIRLGDHIAVNYDVLYNGWKVANPDMPFPVHLGEISHLVEAAKNGDAEALESLRNAFRGITLGGEKYYPSGGVPIYEEIRRLLKQLG